MEQPGRPLRVLAIGGASWNTMVQVDRLPSRSGSVHPIDWFSTVGSSGAGKALNLAGLGVEVTLHAALGDDEDGRRVGGVLEAAGIRLIVARDPAGTARHVNLMDPDGKRLSILLQRQSSPAIDAPALETALASADAAYLAIVDYGRHLVPRIRRHGVPIWTDLHDYDGENPYHEDFIAAADVILLSADRLGDPRAVMERLRDRGKRLIVCTMAERGAVALTGGGRWLEVPAEPAHVVDTNGAGDAFAAGLMVGDLLRLPLEEALQMGARTAALAVGSRELAAPDLTIERVMDATAPE